MGRNVYHYKGKPVKFSPEQVSYYAYKAGFRGNDLVQAVAIAKRESGWSPSIHGSDRPQQEYSGDRGLWQINYVHDEGMIRDGVYRQRTDLFDPQVNANAAYRLYARSGGTFAAWTAAAGGWTQDGNPLYGTNVNEAREAVSRAAEQGMFGANFQPAGWDDWLPLPGNPLPGNPILPPLWDLIPGSDWLDKIPGIPDGTGDVLEDMLGDVPGAGMFVLAADFLRMITDPRLWLRVLQMVGGAILVAIGIVILARDAVGEAIKMTPAGALADAVSQ